MDPKKKQLQVLWPDGETTVGEAEWIWSRIILKFQINAAWLWVPNAKAEADALLEIEDKLDQ
ncbi:MAG TPA: hypothetical protein VKK79_21870 [Candidatus Lokiarchaeia archaeon]|nr:hypothetical protein [Candidatus Lokiarchaeia archaeon]